KQCHSYILIPTSLNPSFPMQLTYSFWIGEKPRLLREKLCPTSCYPHGRIPPPRQSLLGRLHRQALSLLDSFFNRTNHIEGSFWKIIISPLDQSLESLNCVGKIHQFSRRAREHLRHMERLRKKPLNFPCPRNGQLVFLGQLIHSKNGDNVLKGLVTLK